LPCKPRSRPDRAPLSALSGAGTMSRPLHVHPLEHYSPNLSCPLATAMNVLLRYFSAYSGAKCNARRCAGRAPPNSTAGASECREGCHTKCFTLLTLCRRSIRSEPARRRRFGRVLARRSRGISSGKHAPRRRREARERKPRRHTYVNKNASHAYRRGLVEIDASRAYGARNDVRALRF